MVYDIEFIRHLDGKAEALALHTIKLVGDSLAAVITQADELFGSLPVSPRPNGYRIRETDRTVVYEFVEQPNG